MRKGILGIIYLMLRMGLAGNEMIEEEDEGNECDE
jgi:hypothetical protein